VRGRADPVAEETRLVTPLISVIMPVYNARDTIGAAVESLIRQTFGNFEAIIVDDGSEDAGLEVLRPISSSDDRFRLISTSHRGIVKALNLAVAQARGPLLARMDGDDICHPRRFELQVRFLEDNPDVSVAGSLVRSFPRSAVGAGFLRYEAWLNGLTTHDRMVRGLFVESPLAHPSVMMRRSDLLDLGMYKESGWPEDYDLWHRCHLRGYRFGKVQRYLLFWRCRRDRESQRNPRYSFQSFLRLKARYLSLGPLRERRSAVIWGAGRIGPGIARHLRSEGIEIRAFVDIDPKKIGRTRYSAPIIAPDHLGGLRGEFICVAVGAPGARGIIRNWLRDKGYMEVRDYLCVA
jgi:glycosyltransferase involved in cell wall biosynthesis